MKHSETALLGYCGKRDAAFPLPLATYLERDSDGHVSFCYAYQAGVFTSLLHHADDMLAEVLRRRGRDQFYALKKAAAAVAAARAEQDLVAAQWDAHLDTLRADRQALPEPTPLPQPVASNCHA